MWASLAVSCTGGEAQCSLTCSHFPLWEKSWAEGCSSRPNLYCLQGGIMQVKFYCLFYSLYCVQSWIFFFFLLKWYAGTSPLDSLTFTKALLSIGNYLNQCSLGILRLWPRGAESISQATSRSSLDQNQYAYYGYSKTPFESLDVWYWC